MINHKSNEGYLENVDGIRQKTLVYGEKTLLVEFRLTGGKSLPLHSHPHEQTGYLVSGKLNMTIGEEQFLFTPGDSWTIPGDLRHGAEVLEDSVAVEVFSPVREEYISK